MRTKNLLNFDEIMLLRNIVNSLTNTHINNLSYLELVQVSCNLNEILMRNNTSRINHSEVIQIHKKVLDNIE